VEICGAKHIEAEPCIAHGREFRCASFPPVIALRIWLKRRSKVRASCWVLVVSLAIVCFLFMKEASFYHIKLRAAQAAWRHDAIS